MKKQTIVFFGGTFDPVHYGHIYMVNQVRTHFDVDKFIFIPNKFNYVKEKPILSASVRYELLSTVIKEIPKSKLSQRYEISDYELNQDNKTYTIDTIKHFHNQYKNDRLVLLIGSDNFFQIHQWKDYEELLKLVTLCVIRRDNFTQEQYDQYVFDYLHQKTFTSIMMIGNKPYKISSTEIRKKIKQNEDISELVPETVLNILKKHQLKT